MSCPVLQYCTPRCQNQAALAVMDNSLQWQRRYDKTLCSGFGQKLHSSPVKRSGVVDLAEHTGAACTFAFLRVKPENRTPYSTGLLRGTESMIGAHFTSDAKANNSIVEKQRHLASSCSLCFSEVYMVSFVENSVSCV